MKIKFKLNQNITNHTSKFIVSCEHEVFNHVIEFMTDVFPLEMITHKVKESSKYISISVSLNDDKARIIRKNLTKMIFPLTKQLN